MGIPRLLFLCLPCVVGFAQTGGQVNVWMPRGPEGGAVGRPVIDPAHPGALYANAGGRLFKTTDSAAHWSEFGTPSVTILAVDPQTPSTLYGSRNSALFKSTDGGLTWNPSDAGIPCPCYIRTFAIDPADPNVLYAAYNGTSGNVSGGVFKSTDGGETWSMAAAGLPVQSANGKLYSGVTALVIDPTDSGTMYALPALGGIFKSTNGAATWSPVNSGLPDDLSIGSLAIDPRNPKTLYASPEAGRALPLLPLFKSTDGGSNWAIVTSGIALQNLVVDPQDSGTVYGLSSRGVVKSVDAGASWNVVLSDVTFDWGMSWVAVTRREGEASTVYAGGTGRGVLKSSDGGSSWTTANAGLLATSNTGLAIDPRNPRTLFAEIANVGLFRSADGAASWTPAPVLPRVRALAIDPRNTGTVYASLESGELSKTVNGGESWMPLPVDPYSLVWAVDPQDPGTLYAGRSKSTDGGASWMKLPISPTALAIDPKNPATLYAGTMTGEVFSRVLDVSAGILKSEDGGRSWTGPDTLWQGYRVAAVAVDPANSSVLYASITPLDCDYFLCGWPPVDIPANWVPAVFRSADAGATWTKLDLPDDSASLVAIDPQGALYARTRSGLARSTNGGVTWDALPNAGLRSAVTSLAFDPQDANHLFAGTAGAGVFEIMLTPARQ